MTEYKGPCTMCGKNLRKLSYNGPWVPKRLHQKSWKEQQKAANNPGWLLDREQQNELLRRIVREGRDHEVDPRMEPIFREIREEMGMEEDAAEIFARLSIQNN